MTDFAQNARVALAYTAVTEKKPPLLSPMTPALHTRPTPRDSTHGQADTLNRSTPHTHEASQHALLTTHTETHIATNATLLMYS